MSEILYNQKLCPLYVGNTCDEIENARADERAKAIDELKSNCIKHIQNQRPLTLTEIIYIIQFEADRMKHIDKNLKE